MSEREAVLIARVRAYFAARAEFVAARSSDELAWTGAFLDHTEARLIWAANNA